MSRFRVLVADAIAPEGLAPLSEDSRFELIDLPNPSDEALRDALADVDAVLVRSAVKITRASLERADRLRIIGRAGVGVDTIDVEAATERGIAVLTAPSGNTISAAELTVALLLALVRRIPAADRSMKSGQWDRKSLAGRELHGKVLGLVGAGRIGGEVARRLRAFGMRVIAVDPHLAPERAASLEIELQPLDAVLAAADVLSLHVPLTDATAGLLGETELGRMKRGAFLVNASRGGVVREDALERALRSGHLAGAALDVFEEEPLPANHPLRGLEQVVLTPHLGASTREAQHQVAVEIAEAVRRALAEGDLSSAVNAPSIGGEEMRRLRPLLDLAERLGRLAATLAEGPVSECEVRYAGTRTSVLGPLVSGALAGVLAPALERATINLVNATHLARQRGIEVRRVGLPENQSYGEYVELRLTAGGRVTEVAGALLGETHPRVVRLLGFHVDVVPRDSIVILRNRDVPGVIGRVGTLLGDAGVNIGEYHQARLSVGGEALAAITLDGALPATLIDRLRALPEVVDVRQVRLGGMPTRP